MLKKIAVLAFAAAAMLPAAPAGAWDQVCMKLPLWKAWFSSNFHIAYDFPTASGKIPGSYYTKKTGRRGAIDLPKGLNGSRDISANGRIDSPSVHINQTKCADISEIPQGKPFIVYIHPHSGNPAVCETHHSNPDKWYYQTNRPYRTLNYETTGVAGRPKCRYTHES